MVTVSACTERPILAPCGLENFDFQVDPYIGCTHCCSYCYVLDQAETEWSKEILVHRDFVYRLNEEISRIPAQTIYMGSHTDPYQPCEIEYQQTRKALELFLEKGYSASILTKSDLVLRDIDLFGQMKDAAVSVSVAFTDNHTRRIFEADTVDTEKRIAALRTLKEAGVRTGALVCPVIPHITDAAALIDLLKPYADVIWIYGLSINARSGQNWHNTKQILKEHFSDSFNEIERPIFSKDHHYWIQLRERLELLKRDRKLNLNIHL